MIDLYDVGIRNRMPIDIIVSLSVFGSIVDTLLHGGNNALSILLSGSIFMVGFILLSSIVCVVSHLIVYLMYKDGKLGNIDEDDLSIRSYILVVYAGDYINMLKEFWCVGRVSSKNDLIKYTRYTLWNYIYICKVSILIMLINLVVIKYM